MKSVIETITSYKTKSVGPIRDQQVAYIPRIQFDQIDYITPYYILDGKRIPVNITNQLFIKLKYLKFRSISNRKFLQYKFGVYSMNDLVNNKVIIPFMVFINGLFIPWDYLQIAANSDIYHLIIDGSTNAYIADICKNCDFVQIVTLPEYATCVKDYDKPLNAMFVFDEYGKYDVDNAKYYIVSSTGHYSLGFNYWHTNQEVNAFKLINQTDIKLTESNIMLFVNGLFASGVRYKTRRGIDGDYKKPNNYVAPCLDFTYSPNTIIQNPEIRLDSVLLTINNGKNENGDIYDFGLFVNPNYTSTIDNISRVNVDRLAGIIYDYNDNGTTSKYLNSLRVPFRMRMSRRKMYPENLANAIRAISRYNTDLFTPIFMNRSNLVIEEHDYEWISAHNKGGAIHLPILYGDNTTEYIVVLVNGRLYEYSHMIRYFTNKAIIPIQNIGINDTIEFLRFKNINNLEKKVIINEDDGFINYSEDYINNNICLFTRKYNGTNVNKLDIFHNGNTNTTLIGDWVIVAYSEHKEWQFLQNDASIEISALSEDKSTYIELATEFPIDVSSYNSLYVVISDDSDLEYTNAIFTIDDTSIDISGKGSYKIDISNLNGNYIPSIIFATEKNSDGNYTPSKLNIASIYLSDAENFSYEFPEDGDQHFEIGYTLEKNNKGLTKVVLSDPYYYGKELIMTYKNRFKWETFTIEKENPPEPEVLTDTTVSFDNSASIANLGFVLEVGTKYIIYWNDVRYELECKLDKVDDAIYIGNGTLLGLIDVENRNLPFCISTYGLPGAFIFKNTESKEDISLKITEYIEEAPNYEYIIYLGDKFKYCNQYHRYLVFLNNTRLSSDHYRLVLPVRPTTPFTEFKIYLTIPVKEGDKLDILYTPALFQDIIVRDTIDTSGDIVIDKSVLDYGLSTDLYMVWINGKKVAQSNISDIDTTHIRVTSDEKSTNVLCITKYIPSIEAINEAFDANTARWDTITSVMTADEINTLLGIKTNSITDTEPNRYENAASIKAIMNELIRDEFLTNPSIDVNGPFVYDYLDVDTTIVTGYDSGENAMLETTDANHDHNIAVITREYP